MIGRMARSVKSVQKLFAKFSALEEVQHLRFCGLAAHRYDGACKDDSAFETEALAICYDDTCRIQMQDILAYLK